MRRRSLLGEAEDKGYLTIESLSDNNTIKFGSTVVAYEGIKISASTNNGVTWTEYESHNNPPTTIATLNNGNKLLLKGLNKTIGNGSAGWCFFQTTDDFKVKGNIMSMAFGDDFKEQTSFPSSEYYATFQGLFSNCTHLIDASELILPATTLRHATYMYMFSGCTSLISAPELPATTLSEKCYFGMYAGTNVLPDCTNIDFTNAAQINLSALSGLFLGTKVTDNDLNNILPKNENNKYCLPVTSLTDYDYQYMFSGCTNLITAPELPATTLGQRCYGGMFEGCTSLTTLPSLPATTLVQNCYQNMFSNCTSLTSLPSGLLSAATTLSYGCYSSMFNGCTSLTTLPSNFLPATTLAPQCYYLMFGSCRGLTAATITLPATTLETSCYFNMFASCVKLMSTPKFTATTVAFNCCNNMFHACSAITSTSNIKLSATALEEGCYNSMFYGCSNISSAPELPASTLAKECYKNMFNGCKNLSSIKCLARDISATDCTTNWVYGVKSTGTFTKKSTMSSWTTGVNGIPSGWSVQSA